RDCISGRAQGHPRSGVSAASGGHCELRQKAPLPGAQVVSLCRAAGPTGGRQVMENPFRPRRIFREYQPISIGKSQELVSLSQTQGRSRQRLNRQRISIQIKSHGAVEADFAKRFEHCLNLKFTGAGREVQLRRFLIRIRKVNVPNAVPQRRYRFEIIKRTSYAVMTEVEGDTEVLGVKRVAQPGEKLIVHSDRKGMRFYQESHPSWL